MLSLAKPASQLINACPLGLPVFGVVDFFFRFQSRFCSNLGLPPDVQKAATHIARKAVDLDLVPG